MVADGDERAPTGGGWKRHERYFFSVLLGVGESLTVRSERYHRWIRCARAFAGGAILLLLFLPTSDMFAVAQWNLHTWGRLRQLARAAPDTARDLANRELASVLPTTGLVGFLNVSDGDATPVWYFLQYSLAPRTVVPSIDQEFVIEYGIPTRTTGLGGDARFALVKAFAADLRVFRRISR